MDGIENEGNPRSEHDRGDTETRPRSAAAGLASVRIAQVRRDLRMTALEIRLRKASATSEGCLGPCGTAAG